MHLRNRARPGKTKPDKGIVTGETVIGVDLDFETLGSANGMLMVTATGTAVVLG